MIDNSFNFKAWFIHLNKIRNYGLNNFNKFHYNYQSKLADKSNNSFNFKLFLSFIWLNKIRIYGLVWFFLKKRGLWRIIRFLNIIITSQNWLRNQFWFGLVWLICLNKTRSFASFEFNWISLWLVIQCLITILIRQRNQFWFNNSKMFCFSFLTYI